MKNGSVFLIAFSFFIANTYTKDSLKTVQIHSEIAGGKKKKEYWNHQFFDTERKGNGACRAERMDGPSGDRTTNEA